MWESIFVSESITHHPNKMSQLDDSLCIAPTIGNGTPRTREVNGAQHRTTEPMMLADWCAVQQETSSYVSLSCSGLCDIYPVWQQPALYPVIDEACTLVFFHL